MRTILLGPQRRPTLEGVVRSLFPAPDLAGPVATITAGWQEREPDDAELTAHLGGRAVNLGLYRRWLDVQDRDPEYFAGERELAAVLAELQELYLLRLDYALRAAYAVQRRAGLASAPRPWRTRWPRSASLTRRTCAGSTARAASSSSGCPRTTGR